MPSHPALRQPSAHRASRYLRRHGAQGAGHEPCVLPGHLRRQGTRPRLQVRAALAFNRPAWQRPQGPNDAQAPHRAFIVRSSSKCDAGSIATPRTARAACPAHDAPRAAELDGAIAADEAELTLAQAALKFCMRPRLQQRPSRSRLRALLCPLHRDAASDSSNNNNQRNFKEMTEHG